MSQLQPTRAFDALYDLVYTVSGARDHYREQSRAGGFLLERVPEFNNFFSEIPTHPSQTFRFKNNNKVPGHVSREYKQSTTNFAPEQQQQQSDLGNITGTNRYKYFRRPMLPSTVPYGMSPVPAGAVQVNDASAAGFGSGHGGGGGAAAAAANAAAMNSAADVYAMGGKVTTGTQSDYRESEAQTLPYAPDYVILDPSDKQAHLNSKTHTDGNPEVLTIEHLSFANGLPAGLAEVEHIERMRAKRAFEASLPPLTDMSKLKMRQKLMEEWEEAEWAEREREIGKLQEERLDVLKRAIECREEESEATAAVRLERLRDGRLAEKSRAFAAIQQRRVKALRKLGASRKGVFETPETKTIVDDYATFSSTVYAPMTREGKFPDTKPVGNEIDPKPFEPTTYRGILELEVSMPTSATVSTAAFKLLANKVVRGKASGHRKEQALRAKLDQVSKTLEEAKEFAEGDRGVGACWPQPLAMESEEATLRATMVATGGKGTSRLRPTRRAERPETPTLGAPVDGTAAQHRAVVLLQRLLRGRATQNEMFEGKERRIELIWELQIDTNAEEEDVTSLARTAKEAATAGAAAIEMLTILFMPDAAERTKLLAASEVARRMAEEREIDAAAACIQAAQRGRKTRAAAAAKKAEKEANGGLPNVADFDAEDQSRVLKIQAAARGRAARREVATMRAPPPGAIGAADDAPDAAAAAVDEMAAAAEEAIAVETAELVDLKELSEEDRARIVQMQASARGYLARKQLAGMRSSGTTPPLPEIPEVLSDSDTAAIIQLQAAASAHVQKGTTAGGGSNEALGAAAAAAMAGQDIPDLSLLTADEQASVVKMQASVRGYLARKRVAGMKEVGDRLSTGGEIGLVVVGGGSSAEVLDLTAFTPEEEEQVVKIQTAARGHLRMKNNKGGAGGGGGISEEVEATIVAVEEVAAAMDLLGFSVADEQQVVRIQAAARGHLTRKSRRKAAPTFVAAPVNVAGFSADDEAQVVKIQAAARGQLARKNAKAKKAAAGGVAASGGGEEAADAAAVVDAAADAAAEEAAAAGAAVEAAEEVAAAVLPDLSLMSAEEHASVLKIQSAARGKAARKRVAAMRG
eukprot:CAMPEP_0197584104 /NCGR_PEP_ID=MMETSP1326-20131121/6810_1 /TAXON_ID=1155430 /ORGANISM="Genus nov. species nov., Strain RCC2288" /LENGTH=1093 /DNA_ID=CAMNT_0043148417 /DNA_START=227 /DNA_END=3508 /DNA_ORIENTATION=+